MNDNKKNDVANDIIKKINNRASVLKALNNGVYPKIERFIYLKSPKLGYIDEFGNKYLKGEYIFKVNPDAANHLSVSEIINKNNSFSILMMEADATRIFNSRKINRRKCITVGDYWFNGVDYVRTVHINTGLTNVNRYLADLLSEYSTNSFNKVRNAIDGERLVLGHIVNWGERDVSGVKTKVFKIITNDNYLIQGLLDLESGVVDNPDVGDLVTFNSILKKTKHKKISQFKVIGGFEIIKRGNKSQKK